MVVNSLDLALSGLRVNRQGIDLIANNIANAQTEGYTRKILPQEAVIAGGEGIGVRALEIQRFVDENLLQDLRSQISTTQALDTLESYLGRLQAFHGPPDTESAISAELNRLENVFNELASSPDNSFILNTVLVQADKLTDQVNRFAELITQLRNDAQNDAEITVGELNKNLETVASLNADISSLIAQGRSTAHLEDLRDQAIKEISEDIGITFFKSGDGTIVVQTLGGQVLADKEARTLIFSPTPLGPTAYHPGSAAGVYISDPVNGVDLATTAPGGRLGALLDLRDNIFPQYTAQLDEFAQDLSLRFAAQGLNLFTDESGALPSNVVGNYVGYSSIIQVNDAVIADPTLLRSGTTGFPVDEGSAEVARKIIDFAFGLYEREDAIGSVDLLAAPDIFTATGMTPIATVVGTQDLTGYEAPAQLIDNSNIDAGDQFTIQIGAGPAQVVTINAGDTASDLIAQINGLAGGITASLNGLGQIVLEAPGDITLADGVLPNDLGGLGIAALGLAFTTYNAQNPSFTIQVGTEAEATISIDAADTAATLITKIEAAFPLGRVDAYLDASNFLVIEPVHGGDLTILDGVGQPASALGLTISPVLNEAFTETGLGPGGNISIDLRGFRTLEEFVRGIVTYQSEELARIEQSAESETIFLRTLERQSLDTSAVDIDEEVARLIELQTAFSASAQVVTVSRELIDELLATF